MTLESAQRIRSFPRQSKVLWITPYQPIRQNKCWLNANAQIRSSCMCLYIATFHLFRCNFLSVSCHKHVLVLWLSYKKTKIISCCHKNGWRWPDFLWKLSCFGHQMFSGHLIHIQWCHTCKWQHADSNSSCPFGSVTKKKTPKNSLGCHKNSWRWPDFLWKKSIWFVLSPVTPRKLVNKHAQMSIRYIA